jgi:hypothetical protein
MRALACCARSLALALRASCLDFEGLLRNLTEKLRIFVLPAELISCASQIMQP